MPVFKTIIVILLLSCRLSVWAQHYYFRHYQVEEGLSNNTAVCTLQDSNGFLWFGTKDGLNRFDGYTFKVFRNDPEDSTSIGNNSIWRLYEDEHKQLWVGTERGLYKYNALLENFTLLSNSPKSEIRGIINDSKGDIWFIASFKLYRYAPGTKKLSDYGMHEDLNSCTALAKGTDGSVWVGSINGKLIHYNSKQDNFSYYPVFEHSKPAASRWIEKIYDSGEGFLFIGTSNQGVKKFDLATHSYSDILTYNDDNTEIFARDFIRYRPGEYWIATESGIYIYSTVTNKFIHIEKSAINQYALSDNAVYAFTKDKEGGIWVGTYFGGVNYYPKPKLEFEKYFYRPGENSLHGNAVREIKQDSRGNLWIGTEDAGLNQYNPNTGAFKNFTPKDGHSKLSHTNIHGLLVDGDKLWIGTFEHGLDIMDIKTESVIKHYSYGSGEHDLKSNFIYTFYKSTKGEIFIGTSNGLYIYNQAHDNFTALKFLPSGNFFSSVIEDKKGNIWTGTFKSGLFFYNERLKIYGNLKIMSKGADMLSDYRINDLYIDKKENLWICTENGLFQVNPETRNVKIFTAKSGLPGNMVYCIIEDNDSNFWITTSKGLVRLTSDLNSIIIFTRTNGLISNQFNYSSVFKDQTGRIFFGSVKGLISFDPASLKNTNNIPPLYITNFQVNNRDVGTNAGNSLKKSLLHSGNITLSHLQSSISFDFAALNYTAPQNIEYAYKLEGLDKDWNYIKTNRRVYFTNLSPGHYRFLVKSTDSNGNWVNNEKMLSITIQPPLWRTNWAYTIYALLILLIIYGIVSFYHSRQLEKQKIRMVNFEREKEKEMYESKINFFTHIAHEIRTPLTLIKAPMEKLMNSGNQTTRNEKYLLAMNRNTQRLLELTNQLLDFRKIESGEFALQQENTDIVKLVKNIWHNFQNMAEYKKISFSFNTEQESIYAYADEEATTKIISNLIDNGIKYSQSFTTVSIACNPPENCVQVTVSNDGKAIPPEAREKIFEPFVRSKQTDKITGTGIGLSLARSLAHLQGGTLTLNTTGEIHSFVLRLPLALKN